MKVIEGTDAGSIAKIKTGNNGMHVIFFQLRNQPGVGSYFKFNRSKDVARNVGRKSWFKGKGRILVLHKFINL